MWVRIEEEIDALVQFRKTAASPALKAITWRGSQRVFDRDPEVFRDRGDIYFEIRDASTKYVIRYDTLDSKWVLQGIDDHWSTGPHDLPQPKGFLPP